MKNQMSKGFISVVLALSLLLSLSVFFVASAAEQKGIVINVGSGMNLRVRTAPNKNAPRLQHNGTDTYLRDGNTVVVLETVSSSVPDSANPKWSKVRFSFSGATLEGYVASQYIKLIDESDVQMPAGVPKEYESYIRTLLAEHPNWNFIFLDTGHSWSDLFTDATQTKLGRSLIYKSRPLSYRSTQSGAFDWRKDSWIQQDAGGWYQANAQTIAYYMDPRNFLNESTVFMFELLSYDKSIHNINGVKSIIKGSFMDNVTIKNNNGQSISYAQAFMDAAAATKVSPYYLAARVIQEVGRSGSPSVSGNRPPYEGYYNFYNIGASQGSDPIGNGLAYAKKKGWNTQYKAIVGGAEWIENGYIGSKQDTLYFQKFNTANPISNMWHQYMGNIETPSSESKIVRKSYSDMGMLNNDFTFIVPWYRNMPSSACQLPASNNYSPNNWLKSLSVDGNTMGFDGGKTSYSITVPATTSSVNVAAAPVNSKAKISGAGRVSLKSGVNTVNVVVTAENGDKRTYTVNITRSGSTSIPLTGISLNSSNISMYKGDSKTLTVCYQPSNTTDNKTVTWTTSDSSVATVSNGKITAVGKGTATITAKVGNFTKTCTVTVADNDNYKIGDIDADGAVTIADALTIYKYMSGQQSLSSTAVKAADTDRNGKVEITDALRIYKYMSGELPNL